MSNFYIDDQLAFIGELKTIEFEPEPLDLWDNRTYINNLCENNIIFNVKTNETKINKELFKNLSKSQDKWEFVVNRDVQKRRHHKKRINKKWAKRYGFYDIKDFYEMENMELDLSSIASEVCSYNMTGRFVREEKK